MEQQDPNVIRFMDWLDSTMEVLDEKIQTGTVKSNADYLSFFEDKAEELYRQHYMYKCLNDLRSHDRKLETPRQIQEYIQRRRNACLDKLLEQDISARSTSPMSNLAHTLRLECSQQLVREYDLLVRFLTATPRERQEEERVSKVNRDKARKGGLRL